jgi:hypothetical protein
LPLTPPKPDIIFNAALFFQEQVASILSLKGVYQALLPAQCSIPTGRNGRFVFTKLGSIKMIGDHLVAVGNEFKDAMLLKSQKVMEEWKILLAVILWH